MAKNHKIENPSQQVVLEAVRMYGQKPSIIDIRMADADTGPIPGKDVEVYDLKCQERGVVPFSRQTYQYINGVWAPQISVGEIREGQIRFSDAESLDGRVSEVFFNAHIDFREGMKALDDLTNIGSGLIGQKFSDNYRFSSVLLKMLHFEDVYADLEYSNNRLTLKIEKGTRRMKKQAEGMMKYLKEKNRG